MCIEFNHIGQAALIENKVLSKIDEALLNGSKKTRWMRITGPMMGLTHSLIGLVGKVCTIAEAIFKGVCNVVGFPFSNKCSLLKGAKQLCLQLPLHVTFLLLSPLSLSLGILYSTIGMAINPVWVVSTDKKYRDENIELIPEVCSKDYIPSNDPQVLMRERGLRFNFA